MHIFVQNSLDNSTTGTQVRQKTIWKPQIRTEVICGCMCYGEHTVDLVWVIFGVGKFDIYAVRILQELHTFCDHEIYSGSQILRLVPNPKKNS